LKPRANRTRFLPGGARVFQRMYTRLGCQGRPPHFVVEFYPYANLMHTIRLREDSAHVRLSDLLRAAPLDVLEAAAAILLARLYRRRPAREQLETYRDFLMAHNTRRRLIRARRTRGRRLKTGPRGKFHDLAPLFARLNRRYFFGRLHRPMLGWSARAWRAQLGCFDPGLDQIVLNVRLDRASVPIFVVEYVLFHEMLHVKHPIRAAACGLQSHSAKFRQEEKRFAGYERARRFLERLT
jgi:hypothetical protein